jgi:FKBP-type peptidyl-prolyl cis-trans isomerase FkpA
MKKLFLLFGLSILLFSACTKTSYNPTKQAAIDDARIQAYVAANNITGLTKDPSGVYYKFIIKNDSTAHPTDSSTVQVTYTGKLLNGTTFDTESVTLLALTDVVKGWQIAVPYMTEKERMLLIIPSGLGYGTTGSSSVPANSVLVFTIDLIGFY